MMIAECRLTFGEMHMTNRRIQVLRFASFAIFVFNREEISEFQ